MSRREDGLGDVGDETYFHFLWTTIPAIVLTVLGMSFVAVDFETRALAPYARLSRGASFESSPRFTYENLVLPELELDTGTMSNDPYGPYASESVINATVPAMRSSLTCRVYKPSQIRTNFTPNYNISTLISNPLRVDVEEEECGVNPTRDSQLSNLVLSTGPNTPANACFGLGGNTDAESDITGCSDFLFVWGHWSLPSDDATGRLLSQMTQPPSQSLSRRVTGITSYTISLPRFCPPTNVSDTCFSPVTTSRYAVPLTYLGDAAEASTVADALKLQHGIIQAQTAGSGYCGPISPDPDDMPLSIAVVGNINDTFTYEATVSDKLDRRRVIQDPVSTRVLEALLMVMLVFSVIGWVVIDEEYGHAATQFDEYSECGSPASRWESVRLLD
ncbi:hypothetical protein BJ170DRAFT_725623 [Xylariales sp. AK1849]|nr:hypothetical protein BJ170DRAFT_725623 [Xylariales sp. AK1849]